MSKADIYEAKTESLILPILERMNFELVEDAQAEVVV